MNTDRRIPTDYCHGDRVVVTRTSGKLRLQTDGVVWCVAETMVVVDTAGGAVAFERYQVKPA